MTDFAIENMNELFRGVRHRFKAFKKELEKIRREKVFVLRQDAFRLNYLRASFVLVSHSAKNVFV